MGVVLPCYTRRKASHAHLEKVSKVASEAKAASKDPDLARRWISFTNRGSPKVATIPVLA